MRDRRPAARLVGRRWRCRAAGGCRRRRARRRRRGRAWTTSTTSAAWTAQPADGVELTLARRRRRAAAARCALDFRLRHGRRLRGRAPRRSTSTCRRTTRFTFRVRGDCPPRHLEFKLIDSTRRRTSGGANQRDFALPARLADGHDQASARSRSPGARPAAASSRHVGGASSSRSPRAAAAAGTRVDRRPRADAAAAAERRRRRRSWRRASSTRAGHAAGARRRRRRARPRGRAAAATAARGSRSTWARRASSAGWSSTGRTAGARADYVVEVSDDGAAWRTLRDGARRQRRRATTLYLPETEARYVRAARARRRGRDGAWRSRGAR